MVEGYAGEAEALRRLGREVDAQAIVERGRAQLGDAPELRLLLARDRIERSEWGEAEAILAPLAGGRDRGRAAAAWSWIALARLGGGDPQGAREAASAALTIHADEPVARYALRLLPP